MPNSELWSLQNVDEEPEYNFSSTMTAPISWPIPTQEQIWTSKFSEQFQRWSNLTDTAQNDFGAASWGDLAS